MIEVRPLLRRLRPGPWTLSVLLSLLPVLATAGWLAAMYAIRAAHPRFSDRQLSNYFAYYQDLPAAGIVLLFLLAVPFLRGGSGAVTRSPNAVVLALVALIACYAGTFLVFGNYPLSMDEFMAHFDATILEHGSILAALPPEWRNLSHALQPTFLAEVPGHVAWSSAYLPGNALLRALFGLAGAETLTSPALAAASLLLLHSIARKLVPEDPRFARLAVVLLFTSSQFLITAMTPYAMTAHLALNLAWLRLVLDERKWATPAAALVSFFACGLHQMVFHPLFALPFLPWLWLSGRRARAAVLTLALLGAGLFWASYPAIAVHLAGIPSVAGAAPPSLVDRAEDLIDDAMRMISLVFMGDNLARLLLWQNPLSWALIAAALCTPRRQPWVLVPLLGGIVATLGAMILLMPYQGHGWGYRYLHGLLGNLALIGAYGWRAMLAKLPELEARMRAALGASILVSLLLLLPMRAYQAHRFSAPYQRADAAIARIDADAVVIEDRGRWYASDLVRNDPYLGNRPVRLVAKNLSPQDAERLCRRFKVVVLGPSSPPLRLLRSISFRGEFAAGARRIVALRRAACG